MKRKQHEARVDSLSDQAGYQPELYWDATYAIVLALMANYPNHHPEDVGLHQLSDLIVALPGFKDDPAIVTVRILLDIQNIWYEEFDVEAAPDEK